MRGLVPLVVVLTFAFAMEAAAQTVRTWTSNANQNWSQNGNWSGNNRPDGSNEIANFGTGSQLNPELNANSYTVRGLRFSAGADAYVVGDDNGARTLRIGNATSGFVENLSGSDQVIAIANLQFQSDATIRTTDTGTLSLSANLTGNNRDLTFNAAADIAVSGNITTGSGSLTKQGSADLHLSGANTFTGGTTISTGAIVLEAANVFANSGVVTVAAGGALHLNDYADTIARLSGSGTVDFGASGAGALTLASGTSTFSGLLAGSGTLVIGAGATFTLGADMANANLNVVLNGGTLRLAGNSLAIGSLQVGANSVVDFGAADSTLAVSDLQMGGAGVGLTVQNWTDAADFFFSQTAYPQGSAPLSQVQFTGWSAADTKWVSFDQQITPVPESRAYGALLFATAALAAGAGARWRRRSGL